MTRRLLLGATVAAVAVVTLDTTILNVAIPTISADLHTGLTSLQWVIAGYSLTLGALLITGGRIVDVIGVRRAFVSGALLFATGSLLASLATSVPALVIGEAAVEGIGAAVLIPASLATLSTSFEGLARAKAFALWGGVAGIAAALGPVVGGWLATDLSWRWGFRINVVVAPVAAVAALMSLPAGARRSRRSQIDVPGAVLLSAGLFLVVFALTVAPDHGWLLNHGPGLAVARTTLWSSTWSVSPATAAVGGAAGVLAAFVAAERRRARAGGEPLLEVGLFASHRFASGLVTAASVVMAQAGTMFVMAVFLQSAHRLSAVAAGRWLLPVGIGALVGAQAGGRGAAGVGPVLVVRAGILVQLAGVAGAAVVIRGDVGWLPIGMALAVFGLGAGVASSQLTNVILSGVPREQAGAASGVATTDNALAAALGVALLGAVLRAGSIADPATARWALAIAAGLLVAGTLASLTIRAHAAEPSPSPSPSPSLRPALEGAGCGSS